ncbi:MAG: hypothetical protein AB2563_03925 [Candidatus Thiodiazotropha endolucinida]
MNKETDPDAWEKLALEKNKRRTTKGLSKAAREGDSNATLLMIRWSVAVIYHSEDIPKDTRDYLVNSFNRILKGEAPNKVFNIKKTSNKFFKEMRDSILAQAVKHHHKSGMSIDDAVEHVAKNFSPFAQEAGIGQISTVKKAYNKYFPSDKRKK